MKMHSLIFGSLVILLGVSIILKSFGIMIPFFRIVIALFIIYIGVKILLPGTFNRGNFNQTGRSTIFAESVISGQDVSGDYSVVFGSNKIDLTEINLKENVKIKLDTVFGGTEVKIDTKMPVKVKGSAVFGGVTMPNGTAAAFGTGVYTTDSFNPDKPHLYIEANAVFGGVEIK